MSTIRAYLPGVSLCLSGALGAFILDKIIGNAFGLSLIVAFAIILGAVVGNLWRYGDSYNLGIQLCAIKFLKIGVALLGLSISATAIIELGWQVFVAVCAVVAAGVVATFAFMRISRLSKNEALMIGLGCSICGAAAIAATHSVLSEKKQSELVSAIAVITVLGTLMIGIAPAIAHGWAPDEQGIFIGLATHEVSQVVAAGSIAGTAAISIAVATKLGRVLLLAPIIAVLSLSERGKEAGKETAGKLPPIVPTFIVGFIALVAVRTFIDVPEVVLGGTNTLRTVLFSTAMFAQGLGITVDTLRRAGLKTFAFGTVISLVVGVASVLSAQLVTG